LSSLINDISPFIYTQGSLGASGDLAPLAQLVIALLVRERSDALWCQANAAKMNEMGWKPFGQSKEGLALLNGHSLWSAYSSYIFEG